MDNAIRDALRWFLTKELQMERSAVWGRIEGCEEFLKTSTDEEQKADIRASLGIHKTMHKSLTEMWEALWEPFGEAE